MTVLMWLVLGYHLASRLAYVIYAGVALSRQKRFGSYTARWGVEPGFRRFRRIAAIVMINDGASFVVACLVTRHTLHLTLPAAVVIPVGALLVFLGVATKVMSNYTNHIVHTELDAFMRGNEWVKPAA